MRKPVLCSLLVFALVFVVGCNLTTVLAAVGTGIEAAVDNSLVRNVKAVSRLCRAVNDSDTMVDAGEAAAKAWHEEYYDADDEVSGRALEEAWKAFDKVMVRLDPDVPLVDGVYAALVKELKSAELCADNPLICGAAENIIDYFWKKKFRPELDNQEVDNTYDKCKSFHLGVRRGLAEVGLIQLE